MNIKFNYESVAWRTGCSGNEHSKRRSACLPEDHSQPKPMPLTDEQLAEIARGGAELNEYLELLGRYYDRGNATKQEEARLRELAMKLGFKQPR